jgi:excinuclease ABC subunit B
VQTAGRAARHEKGRVILYADRITGSMQRAIDVTNYRREKQLAYNLEHGITPTGVRRKDQSSLHRPKDEPTPMAVAEGVGDEDVAAVLAELEEEMQQASLDLEFERAAILRDQIKALRDGEATLPSSFGKGSRKKKARGRKYGQRRG